MGTDIVGWTCSRKTTSKLTSTELQFLKITYVNSHFLALKPQRLRAIQASPRQALQEPHHRPSLREDEARCLQERNTLRQTRQRNKTVARKEADSRGSQEEEEGREESCRKGRRKASRKGRRRKASSKARSQARSKEVNLIWIYDKIHQVL